MSFVTTVEEMLKSDNQEDKTKIIGGITIECIGIREYSENDDSELIKKIKSFGILCSDDIVHKNGYIYAKDGSVCLDNDFHRDFFYQYAFVKKRDDITKENLVDEQIICPFDDEYNDEDEKAVWYEDYVKNMNVDNLNLLHENEIVLKSSYMNILFKSPNFNSETTFKIYADDEVEGFTMKEIVLKVMQKYHMLYFLYKHYDMEKGIISNEIKSPCFRPVLYESDWLDNGLSHLCYDKKSNTWEFICANYH